MGGSIPKPSAMTLDEERLHFFADLGKALDEWTRVEVHLCCIFMVCLRAPHDRAAAAFYGVENFRSKLRMVDDVAQLALVDPMRTEWKDLHDEIAEKSKLRNALVHHEVLEDRTLKPGRRLALRPAILAPKSPSPFKDVGLHINELRDRQTVFRKLGDEARHFYAVLCERLGLPQGSS